MPAPCRTLLTRCATQKAKTTVTGTWIRIIHSVFATPGQKFASWPMYR